MNFLYNATAHIVFFLLNIIALFNKKINLFVRGRKESFFKLSCIRNSDKVIWIHVASLGEFEQARPIIEEIKLKHHQYKIVVTFFSPSGYEIRKNYELADIVCYLPFDTLKKMKRFVQQTHPTLAIIVKYEFWPNLLNQLKLNSIPTILVSGIFRKEQSFFSPFGGWMRKLLTSFNHFFVQDQSSKELLESINITNVTVSGDTRFDRVSEILDQDNSLDFIEEFKNNQYTIVAGSTWQEDEKYLVNYINQSDSEKIIIAPHNIKESLVRRLQESINKKVVLYSDKEDKNLSDYDVFIIDTIGLLTKIYASADVAYVGGAFKTGLHNILEPATFGIPVIIGPEFSKFKEAVDLVQEKGCIKVNNQEDFNLFLHKFKKDISFRKETGEINKTYVQQKKGATNLILNYIDKLL